MKKTSIVFIFLLIMFSLLLGFFTFLSKCSKQLKELGFPESLEDINYGH